MSTLQSDDLVSTRQLESVYLDTNINLMDTEAAEKVLAALWSAQLNGTNVTVNLVRQKEYTSNTG